MKHNNRRMVLLSAALALSGVLAISSAAFARGPGGAATTPNQQTSQQQAQAQNQEQVQQQVQAQNQVQTQNQEQVQQQVQAQNQVQTQNQEQAQQQVQVQNQVQTQNQEQAQNQVQAQNQLQTQCTAGPRQQHPCSDYDGSQAQEGKAYKNGNTYGPGDGAGPIGCGLFGPGPQGPCLVLNGDGICDCREWKGGLQ